MEMSNIKNIEKLLNDSAYRELIEISANFNTRLCLERKLRMPFLDPQTGIAQRNSNLYMRKTQRLPPFQNGQIYTYPSHRWRCNKRKTLVKHSNRPFFRFRVNENGSMTTNSSLNPINHTSTASFSLTNSTNGSTNTTDENGQLASEFQAIIDTESNSLTGGADTDSNSQEVAKDWYYDDMDANDGVSEEQQDSDFDYNVNGYKRKKKSAPRKSASRKPKDSLSFNESSLTSLSSRSGGGASGGGKSRGGNSSGRSNRSKKGTNSRTKSNKNDKSSSSAQIMDNEPPSFDSVQHELHDGSSDSFAYRNY